MRFNIEGKAFQQQLQAVSKVINAKNTMRILDNFLLRIEGDRLSITGSDSENTLTAFVPIMDVEGSGEIAVPAKRLIEITKEISNQPLSFIINDETCEIDLRFLNGHFNFMGVNAADYPEPRTMGDDTTQLTLPASMVLNGINSTLYAVSTDLNRPTMTGIFWDIHEGDVTFVSSDAHKLVKYVNSEKAPEIEASFILPSKTAGIIKTLLSKEDADVKITFDKKGGLFEFGDYYLYSVFINGNYPNYNRVIPSNNPFVLVADRGSLINSLRRVNLFAPKSSNLVMLSLKNEEVVLSAQDLDYGTSAEEKISCEYNGNDMNVGFNGVFMFEILSNMPDDTVQLALSDPARPGIYSGLEPKEGESLITIQMPMVL
ncbi:MAG: DNA polymerase III subunit beta [Bacteroides sp.]|nr:DNA polymerase III subunit beta [Bacteroidales bacterium]MBD5223967.1 DNA polymerase III subunit beta [Bacteroidales bacterium]MBD5305891.1 DNA polymerase III subunit beta [Bacteroides sp.]MBD5349115.1 DNA polymerase III subunit beta [Bacteroides sp.]